MKISEQWVKVLERIERLKRLDKRFYYVGAKDHRYLFNEPCEESQLADFEKEHGVALPEELRFVFLQVGNGGAGPDWGLEPIENWEPRQPNRLWSGADGFEDTDKLSGMIAIVDRYPSYKVCIICTGERKGQCVGYDGGYIVTNPVSSLAFEYNRWLDENLPGFELVKSLVDPKANIAEIVEQLIGKKIGRHKFLERRDCLSAVASYLNIEFNPNEEKAKRRDCLDPELQSRFDQAIAEFRSN